MFEHGASYFVPLLVNFGLAIILTLVTAYLLTGTAVTYYTDEFLSADPLDPPPDPTDEDLDELAVLDAHHAGHRRALPGVQVELVAAALSESEIPEKTEASRASACSGFNSRATA